MLFRAWTKVLPLGIFIFICNRYLKSRYFSHTHEWYELFGPDSNGDEWMLVKRKVPTDG